MITIRPLPQVLVAAVTAVLLVPTTGWAEPSPGGQWMPITIYGTSMALDAKGRVRFGSEGRIAGNGGCNQFSGTFSTDENTIAIGPLASTRKACAEEVMNMEGQLFKALDGARSFRRKQTVLYLFDSAEVEIARFRQTDAD